MVELPQLLEEQRIWGLVLVFLQNTTGGASLASKQLGPTAMAFI